MIVNGIVILAVVVSGMIKIYHFAFFPFYNAEIAQHYLEIIKLLHGTYLLNGSFTSHPWLRLSGAPYYIFFPIFALFRFHPLTLGGLWLFMSCLLPVINYFVIEKVFDKRTAVISTILISFSPDLFIFDSISAFYNFVIPLTYLLIWQTYRVIEKKSNNVWIIFLIIGCMTTLHASSLFLLPFFVVILGTNGMTGKQIISSFFAFVIPNIPFIIQDFFMHFQMSKNLFLWIPYKFINFISGKTLGLERQSVPDATIPSLINGIKQSVMSPDAAIVFGLGIFFLILYGYFFIKMHTFERILYWWFFIGFAVLLIHKNPPFHYFAPLVIIPIILLARICSHFFSYTKGRFAVITILILFIASDMFFIFSTSYLFGNHLTPSYQVQKKVAETIIRQADGDPFTLARVGEFDQYENQFKENYLYLLWLGGNMPVAKAQKHYIIIENYKRKTMKKNIKLIQTIDQISVYTN